MSEAVIGGMIAVLAHLVATGMKDDDTPIELLGLTVRLYDCLRRSDISTVR
jgi:DNA-directed RNA polymerase alpha subunit